MNSFLKAKYVFVFLHLPYPLWKKEYKKEIWGDKVHYAVSFEFL